MTHLNPMANNLERFTLDLINLTNNKYIYTRRYDHKTGKYSKPLKMSSNDFILVSGLHALYTPILRECYDLKIYLDIDENLRQLLKIKRDSIERGHSLEKILESITRRENDAKKFIYPQSEHCDIKLSIQPVNNNFEKTSIEQLPKLKLIVESQKEFNEMLLKIYMEAEELSNYGAWNWNLLTDEITFTNGYKDTELDRHKGDVLYIENRAPITRASDQTENIKLVIEF
jgi:uridine kinase